VTGAKTTTGRHRHPKAPVSEDDRSIPGLRLDSCRKIHVATIRPAVQPMPRLILTNSERNAPVGWVVRL
jgi:hypothetical protein